MGTAARCRDFRCSGRGGALSPPAARGDEGCNRIRRGRPMCRPGHGSSRDLPTGGHIGPPLRGAEGIPEPTEIDGIRRLSQRGGTEPAPYRGTGAGRRRGAPGVWLPPAKFRNGIWGVSHGHRPLRPAGGRGTARRVVVPYGWLRRAAAIARASGAQRSVCASGCEEMGGNRGRDHPQSVQQRRTIPQSACG